MGDSETVLFIHSQANRDSRPHLIGGQIDRLHTARAEPVDRQPRYALIEARCQNRRPRKAPTLLAHLRDHRGCTGYGIELADANVHACVQRGVNVIQLNLEEGLALFEDREGGGTCFHVELPLTAASQRALAA
mgnify:CR=1 FL=1